MIFCFFVLFFLWSKLVWCCSKWRPFLWLENPQSRSQLCQWDQERGRPLPVPEPEKRRHRLMQKLRRVDNAAVGGRNSVYRKKLLLNLHLSLIVTKTLTSSNCRHSLCVEWKWHWLGEYISCYWTVRAEWTEGGCDQDIRLNTKVLRKRQFSLLDKKSVTSVQCYKGNCPYENSS